MACLISSSVSAVTGIHVMFCSSYRLMYLSVLRVSLCPNSCLTYSSLLFKWYALDALKRLKSSQSDSERRIGFSYRVLSES